MPRYSKLFALTSALTLTVVGWVALFATMKNFSLYMARELDRDSIRQSFWSDGFFSAETGLVATYRFRYLANGGNLCDLYPVAF